MKLSPNAHFTWLFDANELNLCGDFYLLNTLTIAEEFQLRTVPTFVTAYTFCASGDTWVSYGWCLPIHGYFCAD